MYIADLHIHSRFSRATSREGDAPHLDLWAAKKGIALVGTGDFTHPAWRRELGEMLVPAEEGFYTLKPEYRLDREAAGPAPAPRFVVTGEISTIYKKDGRVRKVHHVILLPGLEAAEEVARRLERVGNLHSDGRPILGMDSRDLLELTLTACPQALFIPAHIWTPHFSLFGAFSGFDTVEECFGDLAPCIRAVETGLSSDPPMNWQVSALDRYTLVSNSDAHSPQKLGREANLLEGELSYPAMKRAVETGEGFGGTLEFFPEEGKYHLDGHRNCGVCLTPEETRALGGVCPVCGKKLTIGVQHRVEELADRPLGGERPHKKHFESLAPLPQVIAACIGSSEQSKKTQARYQAMLRELGPEFPILREVPLEDIRKAAGPAVAEGIRRLRLGRVERTPGYDGAFGSVALLTPEERQALEGQTSLFAPGAGKRAGAKPRGGVKRSPAAKKADPAPEEGLDPAQRRAAEWEGPALAVVAGPGTGKTRTLTARILHLLRQGARAGEITAVTFTRRATGEVEERLAAALGGKRALAGLTVATFHAICHRLLGRPPLVGREQALALGEELLRAGDWRMDPQELLRQVSQVKNGVTKPGEALPEELFRAYQEGLARLGALDFDDLLEQAAGLGLEPRQRRPFTHLLVDEFQDSNPLQVELVCQWSREGKSLFVIGDPDQSIYGFRGADSGCFAKLRARLPRLETVGLEENYRSSPQVLGCALPVIACNGGPPRVLRPHAPAGPPVRLLRGEDEFQGAVAIAREIGRMTGGLGMGESDRDRGREAYRAFADIGVLCRTHRQAQLVEHCLAHDSIPCVVAGRGEVLQSREARGLLAFLQAVADPADTAALGACLSLVWDCLPETVARAVELCRDAGGWERARPALEGPAVAGFFQLAEDFRGPVAGQKPLAVLKLWEEARGAFPGLEQLKNMAVFYRTVPEFLQGLLLGEDGDLRRADGRAYASGAVQVMTLHAAKGLEFPVVFLPGLSRGSLPLEAGGRAADLEEERRLFYVGMTRAREELILLAWGEDSPFLEELPGDRLALEQLPPRQPVPEQLRLF